MLFSSMVFIWCFLPIVLILNFIIGLVIPYPVTRIKTKNIMLLLASLVFYAWGSIYYVLIMITSIIINFFGGLLIDRFKESKLKGFILFIDITLNLLILIYFKYFNFIIIIIENIYNIGGNTIINIYNMLTMHGTGELGFKEVILPIGISFFTFQSMSYVIDVYRNDAKVKKNILDFGLYVALFPQLIAGPIVKYKDVEYDINNRIENIETFASGVKRFCYGMGKKVIIANTMAELADSIWALNIGNIGFVIAWCGIFAYALQIYYDFSGYSDMAIGLGRMFGFDFKENFNYPYISLSIQEFWRRWHISLSTWFKEYVYIPLGGNRTGNTYVNLFIVFLLTGIWHGANFTFIAWGVLYVIVLVIERLFLGRFLKWNKLKIINVIYVLMIVNILWVFFRADNIYMALDYVKAMFTLESKYTIFNFLSMKVLIVFLLGIIFMGPHFVIFGKLYEKIKNSIIVNVVDTAIYMSLLLYSIITITSGTYNPFIYFQF